MTARLSPRQARVLGAAADGAPLSAVAVRLGTTRTQVASRLSEAYIALDVVWLPRGERRAEAVRVARGAGLIPNATALPLGTRIEVHDNFQSPAATEESAAS